jgi:hypothetical protein
VHKQLLLEHLTKRRLTPELYSSVSVDSINKVVTFPLWNLSGQMVGFQQYRPDAPKTGLEKRSEQRYFTILSKGFGRTSALSCFGVDLLNPQSKVLFLAEGIFDVSPLHQRGANALAVLANNPKPLKEWLRSLGYYLISLCEGDNAGLKLASLSHESVFLPKGTDPADQTNEWFDMLVKEHDR